MSATEPRNTGFCPDMDRKWIRATVSGDDLAPVLDTIGKIANKAIMQFTPEKLVINALDPGRTRVAEVEYADVEYNAVPSETIRFGVDAEKLASEAVAFYDDELRMQIQDDRDQLQVTKGNLGGYVDLFDPGKITAGQINVFGFDAEVSAEMRAFKQVVGGLSGTGTSTHELEVNDNGFQIIAPTLGDKPDLAEPTDFAVEGDPASMTVESDYLWSIIGSLYPDGEVTIRLKDDHPVEIESQYAVYQIAPKLVSD